MPERRWKSQKSAGKGMPFKSIKDCRAEEAERFAVGQPRGPGLSERLALAGETYGLVILNACSNSVENLVTA
jgi:hypothetical protein